MSRTSDSVGVCPMCGQPLIDEHAAERVVEYEERVEKKLRNRLESEATAAAERKYHERMARATQEIEDLQRKLEAKSARVRGEEQQDALLERLEVAFPEDKLALVAQVGTGDILQTVRSKGLEVGRILHESKNTMRWMNGWIAKIKADGETRRATHLILESRRLPKGVHGYCEREGVLLCQPVYAEAMTHVLRMWMIASSSESGPSPDTHELWEYLRGDTFREHIDALRDATNEEDRELLLEERAHKRWWDARASRAGNVRNAVAGIEDDIHEIAESANSHPRRRTQRARRGARVPI